jgi:hypothetical protein
VRGQALAPLALPQRGVVGALQLVVRGRAVALQQQHARALQLGAGHHARQLPVVAQVFELGQRLEGRVDVARVERDARAHHVAQDHVVGQADVARQRQVHVQQVLGLHQLVGLVHGAGVQHAGPRVAVAVVVRHGMRRIDGHAQARRGLPQPAFVQVEQAGQRLGVHAVEGVSALLAPRPRACGAPRADRRARPGCGPWR